MVLVGWVGAFVPINLGDPGVYDKDRWWRGWVGPFAFGLPMALNEADGPRREYHDKNEEVLCLMQCTASIARHIGR